MTFQAREITSSVSVTSSPSFDNRLPPHVGQEHGTGTTTRSRGRCSGNGFLAGRLRSKAVTVAVFSAAASAAISSSVASASRSSSCSSIWSSRRRVRSALAPYCSRLSLAICSLRCAITASVALSRAWALASLASASSARWVALASTAFSASISSGRGETAASMTAMESQKPAGMKRKMR